MPSNVEKLSSNPFTIEQCRQARLCVNLYVDFFSLAEIKTLFEKRMERNEGSWVPERQLRLFDIRLRKTEIHAFGWKQESSESQSALINQAWSPDGFYITSGSADPTIHIFDIRYDSRKPSQSVQAHQKRVFKAVWHHSLHFLVSISSDLNWLTPDHLKVQLSKFSETHPTLKVDPSSADELKSEHVMFIN
ncbi:hypothetical protein QJS10_CPB22g00372 [Acorus calamus]|uniref:Transducin/WD40 repeat-like superfamily protein n=1 Tax=Acorus calamus TaxID=4465 RepID=A0AAV9BYV0_ACOCL|nr:hypothetical protein QJS10_CPB22g00372 [Acorus calamus]